MNKELPEQDLSLEQGELLASKLSLLMLKPENVAKADLFPHILKNYGFAAEKHDVYIDENTLYGLYPDMEVWKQWVQRATKDHMEGAKLVTFLITQDPASALQHENITADVLHVRGDKTNPPANDPSSLRFVHRGEELQYTDEQGQSVSYFQNGIHCPRDAAELISNLKALGLLQEARTLVGV